MFRFTSTVQYGFQTRFTPAGRLVVGALVVAAFFEQNTSLNMAFQGFTLLTALLVVAFITTLLFKPDVSITRHLPRFGTAGDRFTYQMRVSNHSNKILRGLTFLEMTPEPRPSFEEFVSAKEPLAEKRNVFDRAVGYHRWLWLVRLKQSAAIEETPTEELGPGTRDELRIHVIPRRRGRLHLNGVKIARADAFGLYRAMYRIPVYGSVLILPRRYVLPPVLLSGHRKHQPGGVTMPRPLGIPKNSFPYGSTALVIRFGKFIGKAGRKPGGRSSKNARKNTLRDMRSFWTRFIPCPEAIFSRRPCPWPRPSFQR